MVLIILVGTHFSEVLAMDRLSSALDISSYIVMAHVGPIKTRLDCANELQLAEIMILFCE